jgi:hypothetical protein
LIDINNPLPDIFTTSTRDVDVVVATVAFGVFA